MKVRRPREWSGNVGVESPRVGARSHVTVRPVRAPLRPALLLAMLAVGACGPADEAARDDGSEVGAWGLEEVRRVGGPEGELQLSHVVDLLADSSGLHVLEASPPRIRWLPFHPAHEVLEIGGEGDGPGEFRNPSALQLLRDTLWVVDPFEMRIQGFLGSGEPAQTIRIRLPQALPPLTHPSGLLVHGAITVVSGSGVHVAPGPGDSLYTIFSVDRNGENLGTVLTRKLFPEDFYRASPPTPRFGIFSMPVRHASETRLLRDGSGFAVVERQGAEADTTSSYEVRIVSASGEITSRTRIPYDPIPSEAGMQAFLVELRTSLEERDVHPDDLRAILHGAREGFVAFPFLPPVSALRVGSDGRIWVAREALGRETVRWDVVDPAVSAHVAHVRLPADETVYESRGDRVWVVRTDELDVPVIIEYVIREASS